MNTDADEIQEIEYMEAIAPADLQGPRFGNADEARKIRRLIRFMVTQGFYPHSIAVEGEGYVRTLTERAAVNEVFEWDAYITLRFNRPDQEELFGALLITGNGEDIISDYTCDIPRGVSISNPPPGTFHAAMRAFDRAEEEREV